MIRVSSLWILPAALLLAAGSVSAQPASFEDVVRNLRNPDPKARMEALRYLRQARHVEAAVPVAGVVTDPEDAIQLEAIGTELAFALVEDVPSRRRVGLVVEVRTPSAAEAAFDAGPFAAWPRRAAPEVVDALLTAVDDEDPRVRREAIYAVGVIAQGALAPESEQRLVKALDHYDPEIREAAARVIGRLRVRSAGDALVAAVNDSKAGVRLASMEALGDIREVRAVQALTEQYRYYERGAGARAAMLALARIGDPSSEALFTERLTDKDPAIRAAAAEGLGRVGASAQQAALEAGATSDTSPAVRTAMAFALVKLGRPYLMRLVDSLRSDGTAAQAQRYLLELGPEIAPDLAPHLQEPDPAVRARLADVAGVLGDAAVVPSLQALTRDRDREAAEAAANALQRIEMRR
jgi:HEAT repeat protein